MHTCMHAHMRAHTHTRTYTHYLPTYKYGSVSIWSRNVNKWVKMRKLKKDFGWAAAILVNQIVSKLGTGTSFTHNVYFYITFSLKNKVFSMWAELPWASCGRQIETQLSLFCSQLKFAAPTSVPTLESGLCRQRDGSSAVTVPFDPRFSLCYMEHCHCPENQPQQASRRSMMEPETTQLLVAPLLAGRSPQQTWGGQSTVVICRVCMVQFYPMRPLNWRTELDLSLRTTWCIPAFWSLPLLSLLQVNWRQEAIAGMFSRGEYHKTPPQASAKTTAPSNHWYVLRLKK